MSTLYGIRGWRVSREGALLSTNWNYEWEAGPQHAKHFSHGPLMYYQSGFEYQPGGIIEHPVKGCETCGFYAYSTAHHAYHSCYTTEATVFGVVLLWGDVMAAEVNAEKYGAPGKRYRAEYAQIVALDKGAKTVDRQRYQVSYPSLDEIQLFAATMCDDHSKWGA